MLALVREKVEGVGPDRYLAPEIEAARLLVADGGVLSAAETAIGGLE